jgi:hypothetical protein
MASRKKEVELDDGTGYWVYMEIGKDCKSFHIDVQSKDPMTEDEVLVIIEEWLFGYTKAMKVTHPTPQ